MAPQRWEKGTVLFEERQNWGKREEASRWPPLHYAFSVTLGTDFNYFCWLLPHCLYFTLKEQQERTPSCCLEETRETERKAKIKVNKMEAINLGSDNKKQSTRWTILRWDNLGDNKEDASTHLNLSCRWAQPAKFVSALTSSHLCQGALWTISNNEGWR